jgi:MFS family permease
VTGFAFSAFYAIVGLLIARLTDRGLHRIVILGSLIIWSVMTAMCGATHNFLQLLLARFGVGAGEAGIAPASHATISALFPRERRSTALAIFSAGGPLGILIAFAAVGPLDAAIGWRWTFLLMAAPGLVLALILAMTIGALPNAASGMAAKNPNDTRAALKLLASPLFRNLMLTIAMDNMLMFGIPQWLPAYMERAFAVSRANLGPQLAVTQGLGMLAGMIAGGFVADGLGRIDPVWRMRTVAISLIAAIPFALSIYIAGDLRTALVLAGISAFLLGMSGGPLWAAVQDTAAPDQRATAPGIVLMACSFIGMGLGPFLVGAISDLLIPFYPAMSLRPAMLLTSAACSVLLLLHLALTMRAMRNR